ncbi:MAG: hypothetical protein Q4B60_05450, partial [Erysipelotrichaceae bacterium]|nr:hypothetical protein [Erysipelotrichaceae bacterium]
FKSYGMCFSTVISSLFVIIAYLFILNTRFKVGFKTTIKRLLFIALASIIMVLPAYGIYSLIGFGFNSRIMDIVLMGVMGIIMAVIYYVVACFFHLPQAIFGLKNVSPKALINKLRRR